MLWFASTISHQCLYAQRLGLEAGVAAADVEAERAVEVDQRRPIDGALLDAAPAKCLHARRHERQAESIAAYSLCNAERPYPSEMVPQGRIPVGAGAKQCALIVPGAKKALYRGDVVLQQDHIF